jgi:hypothetical protein
MFKFKLVRLKFNQTKTHLSLRKKTLICRMVLSERQNTNVKYAV